MKPTITAPAIQETFRRTGGVSPPVVLLVGRMTGGLTPPRSPVVFWATLIFCRGRSTVLSCRDTTQSF